MRKKRLHFLLGLFCFSKLCAQIFREFLSGSNSFISGVFLCSGSCQKWGWVSTPEMSSDKKDPEMNELGSDKKTLKIWAHNVEKHKS